VTIRPVSMVTRQVYIATSLFTLSLVFKNPGSATQEFLDEIKSSSCFDLLSSREVQVRCVLVYLSTASLNESTLPPSSFPPHKKIRFISLRSLLSSNESHNVS
jgi:hypothetical protein